MNEMMRVGSINQNKRSPGTLGILIVVVIAAASIVTWLAYLNRPCPEYEVTQVSTPTYTQTAFQDPSPAAKPGAAGKPQQELPFHINIVYSPGYLIDLGGLERLHPFDIKKYQKIHEQLKADGLVTEQQTLKPSPLTTEDLRLIHSESYLEELKDRKKVAEYLEAGVLQYAPVAMERAVLLPFRRASGGTLLAARMALETGIGINLGGGYHHAKPDCGEGFCLFADVPIAIRKLQNENLIKRAVVIDVDVHQGNGTILCLDNDDTTFTFSMHQGDIYPIPKETGDLDVELKSGMGDQEYLKVLDQHLSKVLDDAKADVCFIVGGCDPLAGDPLASLEMTHAGIVKRDQAIVDACVKRKMPVVLTLSGGYSPDAWKSQYLSIKNLIEKYKLRESKVDQPRPEKSDQ
jgi:histone deacetylase 11